MGIEVKSNETVDDVSELNGSHDEPNYNRTGTRADNSPIHSTGKYNDARDEKNEEPADEYTPTSPLLNQ